MKADQIEPIYTVRDVAKQYRVTPQTVYNWINDGRIQCLRLTGTVRFRPKHLEEFEARSECSTDLEKQETAPTKFDGQSQGGEQNQALSVLKTKIWRKSG